MGPGLIPSQGAKIPETAEHDQRKRRRKEMVWKTLMFLFALEDSFLTTRRNICPLVKINPMQGLQGIDLPVWMGNLYFKFAGLHVSCFNLVQLCDRKTVARQAPLSVGFPRQEYWSGLPFPPPGDLSDQGIEPASLLSPALAGGFFTTSATWKTGIVYGKQMTTRGR